MGAIRPENLGRYTSEKSSSLMTISKSIMKPLTKKCVFLSLLTAVIAASYGSTSAAESTAIISKIQNAAKQDGYEKAIQILDREFDKNKNIRLELLVIKAELNFKNQKPKDSIDIYKNLINDYPEKIFLYNNLAAIYAEQGNLEAAEMVIMNGFKQQLDLDLAFQNLMRIKGRQASLALQKAVNPSKVILKNVQLITTNQINGFDLSIKQEVSAQNKMPLDILAEKPITTIALNTAEPQQEPNTQPFKIQKTSPSPEISKNIKDLPNSKENDNLSTQPIKSLQPSNDREVLNLLNAWASAWSSGNAESYLSYYSSNFNPEGQVSAEKWRSLRQQRITPDQGINVRIENIEIEIKNSNSIEASFKQFYTSRSLKAQANKKITFGKQNNQWKIVREEVVKQN